MASSYFIILSAVLGLVLGSFYSACVYRYVAEMSIVSPARSFCPKCGHTLSWFENIPLLSYIALGGKCRSCKAPISLRYPLIEFVSAVWAVSLALVYGPSTHWVVYMAFGGMFITASFIDFDIYILPDLITMGGAALAPVCAIFVLGMPWKMSLLGAAFGGGLFWAIQRLYRAVRGIEGLGTGDVKLMLLIGGLLGPMALPLVIISASVLGIAAGLVSMARPGGKGLKTRIAFGPFLCLGAMLYILFGDWFWDVYLGLR